MCCVCAYALQAWGLSVCSNLTIGDVCIHCLGGLIEGLGIDDLGLSESGILGLVVPGRVGSIMWSVWIGKVKGTECLLIILHSLFGILSDSHVIGLNTA